MLFIGFRVEQAREKFFDRRKIESAVDSGTRKVLSRFGAFVRRRAKSSIRKRKKVARPGRPPTNRTGLLRKFIFFVFDAVRRSVIVGPAKLNRGGPNEPDDAPEVLEHGGGTLRRLLVVEDADAGRPSFVSTRKAPLKRVRYEPRPFMGPAMTKELPELPEMWRDSIV